MEEMIVLKCESKYCIHNRNFKCKWKNVSIDSLGMCDSYIIVELDEEFLKTEKERQVREIKEIYRSFQNFSQ